MFCIKFSKIYLNRVLKTSVLKILYYVLIEPVYNVIVDEVMVYYLKFQAMSKKSFEVVKS